MFLLPISIILTTLCIAYAKIYERCELARELRNFDLPEVEIPTWVCIAQHESNFDTSAMNPGSGDHGLFQISQLYWCSPPGDGYGCNSPCSKFRDDDIADDLQCIKRIYNEHTRISGDGFNAWVVYPLYCKNDNSKYIQSCFDQELPIPPEIPVNATENEIPYDVDEYGDGYQFPSLPNFSKNLSETEEGKSSEPLAVGDGYEFPKLPFSRISILDYAPVKDKYKFPVFPYSRESIHDFIPVHRQSNETLYSVGDQAEQDVIKFPIRPAYNKHSIHHFTPVQTTATENVINVKKKTEEELEYNLLPLSKTSEKPIHELPAPKPTEKLLSSHQQDLDRVTIKPVYSKQSILHFVPVSTTFNKDLINGAGKTNELPKLNIKPLDEFLPAPELTEITILNSSEGSKQDLNEFIPQPVYSKQSIHHSIPVSKKPNDPLINIDRKIIDGNSEYMFPPLPRNPKKTSEKSNPIPRNKISQGHNETTYINNLDSSRFSISPKSSTNSNLLSTTTYKPTTNLNSIKLKPFSSMSQSSSIIPNFEKSTIKTASSIVASLPEPTNEPHRKVVITTQKLFTTGIPSLPVSTKRYATSRKPYNFTNKLFITTRPTPTTRSLLNTAISKQPFISTTTAITTSKPIKTPFTLNFSTSDSKPLNSVSKSSVTISKPLIHPLTTDKPFTKGGSKYYDLQVASSTLTPFTASTLLTTTLKPFLTFKPVITPIFQPSKIQKTSIRNFNSQTTTLKPLPTPKSLPTTTSKHLTTRTTVKPLSMFKHFTTTSKPFTTQNLSFKSQITTSKPSSSFRTTSKPFKSQKTTVPFAQRVAATITNKPFTLGTKVQSTRTRKPVPSTLVTTLKPSYNFTHQSFSTAAPKQLYTNSITTLKPLTRQVTFAPDSFFSWIFGSQTLPPIVSPGRPPRPSRPFGDRPGVPLPSVIRPNPDRPGINQRPRPERPSRLPRPSRPERPGKTSLSVVFDNSYERQDLSDKKPELIRTSTTRPLDERTASPSRPSLFGVTPTFSKILEVQKIEPSIMISPTRESLEKQKTKPSIMIPLTSFTTASPKSASLKEIASLQQQESAFGSSRQFSSDKLFATKKLPNTTERSKFKPYTDEYAFEIKLDDNFVYLRTRFGYRLFRNNKN